jgi:hypothetical protein
MPPLTDKPIYEALVLPNEAISNGGVEILRAGMIDDKLFVTARRVFSDPAKWGEVLADIVRRLSQLYAAEGKLKRREAMAAIESAFAAGLGAPVVKRGLKRRTARGKRAAPSKPVRRRSASRAKARRR